MARSVIVTAWRPAKLFILGLSALGMGVLVYALDRPAGSVAFLPAGMAAMIQIRITAMCVSPHKSS